MIDFKHTIRYTDDDGSIKEIECRFQIRVSTRKIYKAKTQRGFFMDFPRFAMHTLNDEDEYRAFFAAMYVNQQGLQDESTYDWFMQISEEEVLFLDQELLDKFDEYIEKHPFIGETLKRNAAYERRKKEAENKKKVKKKSSKKRSEK